MTTDRTAPALRVLDQRLRTVAGIRVVLVAAVATFLATGGQPLVEPGQGRMAALALLLPLAFSLTVPLWPSVASRVVLDLSVVVDAATLALGMTITGGVTSPLGALAVLLVALHLMAFGVRTGVRIGVAVTLAVGWVWATADGTTSASQLSADTRMVVVLLSTWIAVAAVAMLSRVVEHDLRVQAHSLDTIRQIERAMEPDTGAVRVAEQLATQVTRRMEVPAASVWLRQEDERLVLVAWSTGDRLADPLPDLVLEDDPLPARALAQATTTMGRPRSRPLQRVHPGEAALVRIAGPDGEVHGLLAITPPRGTTTPASWTARALEEVARDAGTVLDEAGDLERLHEQARTDPVTGLLNHRALQERLRSELARMERRWAHLQPGALSLALFDLDHFKQVNDTHGHPVGDAVLAAVASAVADSTRTADAVCRYGGEEFAIVLVDTGPDEARLACERFREAVAGVRVPAARGAEVAVTASFGVASVTGPGVGASRLVDLADEALYRAKRGGRNRVVDIADATAPAAG